MSRSAFGGKNCDTTFFGLSPFSSSPLPPPLKKWHFENRAPFLICGYWSLKFCVSLLCLPFQRRHRSHPLFVPCCSKLLDASQDPARLSSERELELLGSLPGSSASYRDTNINKKKAGEILLILKNKTHRVRVRGVNFNLLRSKADAVLTAPAFHRVAWVQLGKATPFVSWVKCWLLPLRREVFSPRTPVFHCPLKVIYKLP